MGVIKDGKISGKLPDATGFAVHYPGYPSSTSRAITTLGGTQSILKARSGESNKLELHFRPEDPYSHPVVGDRKPCTNFLLKISRTKTRNGQEPDNTDGISTCLSEEKECQIKSNTDETEAISQLPGDESLCADIIAQVSDAYHFNGMVDYQHVLPIHADVARRKKRTWEDVESEFDKEDLLMLVPPRFSMKNVPDKVVLKPCGTLGSKKKSEGVVQQRVEEKREPCRAIDFYIENVPNKVDWEKDTPKGSEQYILQTAVGKLFDERPIWSKNSVAELLIDQGLECSDFMLRKLLYIAAYYFSNGPFLRLYIRKGYDPRNDPESRIYQRTDFRVPESLRSYCDANAGPGLQHRWRDICSFRVFPYKCQTLLQLFELSDDYIQKEIRKPPELETCSLLTGWFSANTLNRLRLCVAVRFIKVYPQTGAESILKAKSELFEKAKRMLLFPKDPKPGEQQEVSRGEKTLQQNEEEIDNEDQEELNIDDEDEEEEEEEEIDGDDVEEEFDPYDDSNISRQPSLYDDEENISRSYLQDLFGSFPSSGLQGADNSEGEYEIYGHNDDDDDNASDDDFS